MEQAPTSSPADLGANKGKDSWDKFASVSRFLSGVVIASMGLYATTVYNTRQIGNQAIQKERELAIQRVQTIEKFLPYLSSSSPEQKLAALDAVAALGDEELAMKLAARFGGSSGASALASLTKSDNAQVARDASRALSELFASVRLSVFALRSGGKAEVAQCTGFFVTTDGLAIVPLDVLVAEPNRVQLEQDGPLYPVTIVNRTASGSLALVKVSVPQPVTPIRMCVSGIRVGDQVFIVGYAPGVSWVSLAGRVVSIAGERIYTDARLLPGMAGAPVVNARAELIGVAAGSTLDRQASFLIPVAAVQATIKASPDT